MMNNELEKQLIDNAARAYQYALELIPTDFKNGEIPTHFDMRWQDEKGKSHGYGYLIKKLNPREINIGLIRCPACHRENYAMNVTSGFCTWCPFDANQSIKYLRDE